MLKKAKVLTFQKSYSPTSQLYYKNVPLIETKEYKCLGNVIYYKGNFKRAIQELTKKGLKILFALRSRFANFQSIPITLSCNLFDILVRPVPLHNSEIWFMNDYLSIFRALNRSNKNNMLCDTLSLEEKFQYVFFFSPKCFFWTTTNGIVLYFFPPPKSEYFFSNIGNQNIFFRKKPITPLQVKWSFPYRI